MEPNTSVCNCGGDVQSSRKSKSNPDGFCRKAWLLLVMVLKVVLVVSYPWKKAGNGEHLKGMHGSVLHIMDGAMQFEASLWLSCFLTEVSTRSYQPLAVTVHLNCFLNCCGINRKKVGRNLHIFQHRGRTSGAFSVPGSESCCFFLDSPSSQRCSISS